MQNTIHHELKFSENCILLNLFFRNLFATKILVRNVGIEYSLLRSTSCFFHRCHVATTVYPVPDRSSQWSSVRKGVLKNFTVFTEERLCWSLFLIKLQVLRLIFTVMFLKTPILKSICTLYTAACNMS